MRRAASLVLTAVAIGACLAPAPLFSLTLDGKSVVEDLPVLLEDRTGRVVAVAPALPAQFNLKEGVTTGDDPSQVVVSWVGGLCDTRAYLAVDAQDGTYTVVESREAAGTCRGAGVLRTVTILFSVPVDPDSVTIEHR